MSKELFSPQGLANNYNKAIDITITSEADPGEEVVALFVADMLPGSYAIAYAFQVTYGTRNRLLYYGLTGDLADAVKFTKQVKDDDDLRKNRLYGYPFEWAGGDFSVGLNMYIESGAGATIDLSLIHI